MSSQFLVLSLPRSRSFWLSRYLSYGPWHCGHDEIIKARSLDDVKSWLSIPFTGTCETAVSHFWRLIRHYSPDIRIVTVRRSVDDVLNSLEKLGFDLTDHFVRSIKTYDKKLDQIESRIPDVKRVEFDDLNSEILMKNVFEYLLEIPHETVRFRQYSAMNLQSDMNFTLRYYKAYQPQITKLAKVAKAQTISLMQSHDKIDDGITIQEENLESILRDGPKLFAEHSNDIGEAPDSYLEKNLSMMAELEKMECLQIHTARCNGRLFGYLATIMSPSLERQNTRSGVHTIFYTSKDARNIGMRLQRASIQALKEKGCDEVIFRAGIRGTGAERIGSLYKRLGATDFGQLYRLDLEA